MECDVKVKVRFVNFYRVDVYFICQVLALLQIFHCKLFNVTLMVCEKNFTYFMFCFTYKYLFYVFLDARFSRSFCLNSMYSLDLCFCLQVMVVECFVELLIFFNSTTWLPWLAFSSVKFI